MTSGQGATGPRKQAGFTLIELLVVVLIMAILAGIAVPLFLSQRNKARIAAVKTALRNASTTAYAFGVGAGGDFSDLAQDGSSKLIQAGYRNPAGVLLAVGADPGSYCLLTVHELLPGAEPWRIATFDSTLGQALTDDSCTGAPTPELPPGIVAEPEDPGGGDPEPPPSDDPSPTPTPTAEDPAPLVTLTPLPELTPLPTVGIGGL